MASSLVSRLVWRFLETGARMVPFASAESVFSRLSSERRAKSTPAELHPLVGGDRRYAGHRLVGDKRLAAVDAVRLRPVLDILGDLLDAVGGHQQRVLLRGRVDDALLDPRHREAAAV